MFQISESSGEVLQSVLQVEVLLFQSVDGVLELVGWAAVWMQKSPPQKCGDFQDGEHVRGKWRWLDVTEYIRPVAGHSPVKSFCSSRMCQTEVELVC